MSVIDLANESTINGYDIINELGLNDDTFNHILFLKQQSKRNTINSHINSELNGHSLYAYYKFEDNHVLVFCHEWDLNIFRPSDRHALLSTESTLSAIQRRWFTKYMINFLDHIISQIEEAGYSWTFRICKIQSVDLETAVKPETNTPFYQRLLDTFNNIYQRGDFFRDRDSKGNIICAGIEFKSH